MSFYDQGLFRLLLYELACCFLEMRVPYVNTGLWCRNLCFVVMSLWSCTSEKGKGRQLLIS